MIENRSYAEVLVKERRYYQEKRKEAMDMPPGDVRNIRMYAYTQIIDVLNATLMGRYKSAQKMVSRYLQEMKEKEERVKEWQEAV